MVKVSLLFISSLGIHAVNSLPGWPWSSDQIRIAFNNKDEHIESFDRHSTSAAVGYGAKFKRDRFVNIDKHQTFIGDYVTTWPTATAQPVQQNSDGTPYADPTGSTGSAAVTTSANATTAPISAPSAAGVVGTIAGIPITASAGAREIAIASQTITLGGPPITITGDNVVGLGPNGIWVQMPGGGMSTITLGAAPTDGGPAPVSATLGASANSTATPEPNQPNSGAGDANQTGSSGLSAPHISTNSSVNPSTAINATATGDSSETGASVLASPSATSAPPVQPTTTANTTSTGDPPGSGTGSAIAGMTNSSAISGAPPASNLPASSDPPIMTEPSASPTLTDSSMTSDSSQPTQTSVPANTTSDSDPPSTTSSEAATITPPPATVESVTCSLFNQDPDQGRTQAGCVCSDSITVSPKTALPSTAHQSDSCVFNPTEIGSSSLVVSTLVNTVTSNCQIGTAAGMNAPTYTGTVAGCTPTSTVPPGPPQATFVVQLSDHAVNMGDMNKSEDTYNKFKTDMMGKLQELCADPADGQSGSCDSSKSATEDDVWTIINGGDEPGKLVFKISDSHYNSKDELDTMLAILVVGVAQSAQASCTQVPYTYDADPTQSGCHKPEQLKRNPIGMRNAVMKPRDLDPDDPDFNKIRLDPRTPISEGDVGGTRTMQCHTTMTVCSGPDHVSKYDSFPYIGVSNI